MALSLDQSSILLSIQILFISGLRTFHSHWLVEHFETTPWSEVQKLSELCLIKVAVIETYKNYFAIENYTK